MQRTTAALAFVLMLSACTGNITAPLEFEQPTTTTAPTDFDAWASGTCVALVRLRDAMAALSVDDGTAERPPDIARDELATQVADVLVKIRQARVQLSQVDNPRVATSRALTVGLNDALLAQVDELIFVIVAANDTIATLPIDDTSQFGLLLDVVNVGLDEARLGLGEVFQDLEVLLDRETRTAIEEALGASGSCQTLVSPPTTVPHVPTSAPDGEGNNIG